ncbi:MOSC domain-containing protein [Sulfurimonas sp. SAG-AH-194-C21]|nr:MOSC domain-containing protein [Sulfurimonas sp. SAG-AH-194-C21]MDF1883425.1 MOSC domain-containing protein [Sulfurimonas sp. SAG-AH-194-C21]
MMTGTVKELYITQNDTNKTRQNVNKIYVDNAGVINDKFYNKNVMRAILITSVESYLLAKDNQINIQAGSLGENILIDINPYNLIQGDRIKIGNTILEITQNCTLCQGLSSIDSKLPKLLKNDRGIFAKYIEGNSEILLGSRVEILNT